MSAGLAFALGVAVPPLALVLIVVAVQVRALVRGPVGAPIGRFSGYECPECGGLSMSGGPFPWWVPGRVVRRLGHPLARRRHWRNVHGTDGPFPK